MNVELVKSLVLKFVPVLAAYLIGKGVPATVTDRLPELVDWLVTGAVLLSTMIPTIIRSIKVYRNKKPVDLVPG